MQQISGGAGGAVCLALVAKMMTAGDKKQPAEAASEEVDWTADSPELLAALEVLGARVQDLKVQIQLRREEKRLAALEAKVQGSAGEDSPGSNNAGRGAWGGRWTPPPKTTFG